MKIKNTNADRRKKQNTDTLKIEHRKKRTDVKRLKKENR